MMDFVFAIAVAEAMEPTLWEKPIVPEVLTHFHKILFQQFEF